MLLLIFFFIVFYPAWLVVKGFAWLAEKAGGEVAGTLVKFAGTAGLVYVFFQMLLMI